MTLPPGCPYRGKQQGVAVCEGRLAEVCVGEVAASVSEARMGDAGVYK